MYVGVCACVSGGVCVDVDVNGGSRSKQAHGANTPTQAGGPKRITASFNEPQSDC